MTNDIVEKVARAINASGNGWLSDAEIEAAARAVIPFITAAHVEGVKMGLEAAAKAADESIDALSDDCCLDHVGDAVAAIRNLDAEAIVKEHMK